MKVIQLKEQDKQQYIDFVAAHPSGSFLQSWQWGEFQTTHSKQAVRYGVFDKTMDSEVGDSSLELICTVQFLLTKIPKLPGTYLYAPYGPLVSKNIDESILKTVLDSLLAQIKKDFSKAWFIRFEPQDTLPIDGKPTLHIQPGSTLVTDLTLSEEELLTAMHPKTRYNIKVAAKHDVTVQSELTASPQNGLRLKEAVALLTNTSKRQGYKSHPASYYMDMLTYFGLHNTNTDCKLSLYQAIYKNECVASAIMIDHGTNRTYLFGGSDSDNKNVMAPYALHWQAMRDAKAQGFTIYDWWGTETASGSAPGFVQFKLRWGGVQKFYSGARDIVLNSSWYLAYNALRKVNRLM